MGSARCFSICCRNDISVPTALSSSAGTSGGGGGISDPRMLFSTYLPRSTTVFVQAALFIAIVGALPLYGRQPLSAAWWPPVWFRWLWESIVTGRASARPALLAVVLPAIVAVGAYLLSYHRYRKLLLEAPPARP